MILQVENLADDLPVARERLHGVAAQLAGVIRDVRTYIHGLRAHDLEGRLLSEGLVALVQEINERGDLTATSVVEGTPYRLPSVTTDALLQIARDALSTVLARAAATQVHVRPAYGVLDVTLTITDKRQVGAAEKVGGDEHPELANLRARAEEVGGTLGVHHVPGSGTTITVFVQRDHDAHAPVPPAGP